MDEEPFGAHLRRLRLARGLTQEQLAERAACSVDLIRKIERQLRRPSAQMAARLAESLALAPRARPAFLRLARGDRPAPLADALLGAGGPALAATNLPSPVTSFVGRAQELARLRELLTSGGARLVTITGTGGVGKTRLAIEAAAGLRDVFADGVWLVRLAPVADPALVAGAVASALGIPESSGVPLLDRLAATLRPRHTLLVIDNLEHLRSAAPLIGELLAACPLLKVLATSRLRLGLYGEWELALGAMGLPPDQPELPSSALLAAESAQLFVARAQMVRPSADVSESDGRLIAALCRRLDGLPLALELAAARLRSNTLATLLAQLSPALPWLTDGPRNSDDRLQSMRAAIAWSHALLTPEARALFARLGVFVGGWTADAARRVCVLPGEPAPDVAALLAELSDHALVQAEGRSGGYRRYSMLEIIREYALEQLALQPAGPAVRRRHADHALALAEDAEPELRGAAQLVWLERLDVEQANLRAALTWCLEDAGDRATGARLAVALGWFWWLRNRCHEGAERLGRAAAHAELGEHELHARLLTRLSMMALGTSDFRRAEAWAAAARRAAEAAPSPTMLVWATALEAISIVYTAQVQRQLALLVEALHLAIASADSWLIATVYWNLASSDLATAQQILPLDAALALAESSGDRWSIACVRMIKSRALYQAGAVDEAVALLTSAAALARALGDRRVLTFIVRSLGRMSLVQGQHAQALACFAECRQLGRESGEPLVDALMSYEQGQVHLAAGDRAAAAGAFVESLALFRHVSNESGAVLALLGLAALQPPARAAQLLAAVSAALGSAGVTMDLFRGEDYARTLASVRASLDEAAFAAAWAAGLELDVERALALALQPAPGASSAR